MTDCDCTSCRNIPVNIEINPDCLVDKLREKCKSIFPSWRFNASFNTSTKKSSLYIITYTKSLDLSIQQVKDLHECGYAITKIEIELVDFEYLGNNMTNYYVNDDDCMIESDPEQKFKPIIYVEEC